MGKIIRPGDIPKDCEEEELPFKSWGHMKKCFGIEAFKESVTVKMKVISENNFLGQLFATYAGDMS